MCLITRAFLIAFVCMPGTCFLPPGRIFNLTRWELELPVSNGNGGQLTVKNPTLSNYSSKYFFLDSIDKGMTFWAPINGATSHGSTYPRCELRETKQWSFRGAHQMNVTLQVLQQPETRKISIGQILKVNDDCVKLLQVLWVDGTVYANVHDKKCQHVGHVIGKYSLGEKINYSITVLDTALTVATDRGRSEFKYSWFDSSVKIHFKVGDYVQQHGDSSRVGGKVKITRLNVVHLD